ncbi:mitochondrial genome maintenance MGM101 [Suhomyces tanzawaensis NRRL Y-17324]|uniref:Mitochondrial genome maintenance protein MGM101 n=1 Tax=Suhomyces tanzawaensis NRRL Y-17324 TaxID=984487 RepID=A0A1E4SD06_9ASCO|nr:mitochondrial genome maintenance MGM101 [Suhomyces tanzawaensis NRRL Y-17324]ODV77400.1 mitochondrial genome maintenance MGM101 [Suhomyces tanzawaensis NRRL Y-17324]
MPHSSWHSTPNVGDKTASTPSASTSEGSSTSESVDVSFKDSPIQSSPAESNQPINWSDSFHGLGSTPFAREVADILLAPIAAEDIEIKPDGLLYLPEIKYRRILNRAFGPGGWGLAPRTESYITPKQISREYALICHGRLVSVARGEQDYFGGEEKVTTALEGCKSNALMRCCKDLGIASELWDPSFIRDWKKKYCDEVFAEHVTTKKKKKLWKLKKNKTLDYPYKIC